MRAIQHVHVALSEELARCLSAFAFANVVITDAVLSLIAASFLILHL